MKNLEVPKEIRRKFKSWIRTLTIYNQITGEDEHKQNIIRDYIRAYHEFLNLPTLPPEFSLFGLKDIYFEDRYLVFRDRNLGLVRIYAPV